MNRVDIASFDELLSASRRSLLDGFITGQPIANVIGGILSVASAFGGDEADRGAHPIATTPIETFDELKREAVAEAVDNLFAGSKLDSIVRNACVLGMAFGFKNVHAKQNATGENEIATLDTLLTAEQAAKYLGISRRTFDRRCINGQFPDPVKTVKQRPLVWRLRDLDAIRSSN